MAQRSIFDQFRCRFIASHPWQNRPALLEDHIADPETVVPYADVLPARLA
jgi:hypothetical protein